MLMTADPRPSRTYADVCNRCQIVSRRTNGTPSCTATMSSEQQTPPAHIRKPLAIILVETFTNDIGIDIGVNYAVEAGFWEIFSESLGISADTTYDWSHMSSSSQSKTTTITVSAVAPAGTTRSKIY